MSPSIHSNEIYWDVFRGLSLILLTSVTHCVFHLAQKLVKGIRWIFHLVQNEQLIYIVMEIQTQWGNIAQFQRNYHLSLIIQFGYKALHLSCFLSFANLVHIKFKCTLE